MRTTRTGTTRTRSRYISLWSGLGSGLGLGSDWELGLGFNLDFGLVLGYIVVRFIVGANTVKAGSGDRVGLGRCNK